MKMTNKMLMNSVISVVETPYYKLSFILMVILSFYGGYISMNMTYLNGFLTVLTNKLFFTWGVLIPFLIITLCTYIFFHKSDFLILRFNNKKEYLKNMLLTIFFVNLFSYVVLIVLLIICLNIFPKKGGFGFVYNPNLNCHNFIYLVFILFRLFCIIQLISIINALLCKLTNIKFTIMLNMILYASLILLVYFTMVPISSVLSMPLYIGNYLIISMYSSFGLELLCTIIYFSILLVIIYFLYYINNKRIGDIKV